MSEREDSAFMRMALRLARRGLGNTTPNPAVGAVIVADGRVIARGYHHRAGLPHAEREALAQLGDRAPGGTLYVTLEPCHHRGRTPPCTEAIVASGLRRVVIGMNDPNPDVRGGGCRYLQKQGLEVVSGVLEAECRRLNEVFIRHVTSKRPFVAVKSALTLDGWTATRTGSSRWVTGPEARRYVHRLRARLDAVMVGIGTVLADDPRLTVRLGRRQQRQPLRIVVDTSLRVPEGAKVLQDCAVVPTLLAHGPDVQRRAIGRLHGKGVTTLALPRGTGGVDLHALMDHLGKMKVTGVLIEGGAALLGSLVRARLVDRFYIFKAPKLLGGGDGVPMIAGTGAGQMTDCVRLGDIRTRRYGGDLLIEGVPLWDRT